MRPVSAAAVLAGVFLTGCVQLFPQPIEDVHRGRPATPTTAAPRGGAADSGRTVSLASKPVSGKEAPATLVARDGTRCTVTEERFREVALGERVTCAWR